MTLLPAHNCSESLNKSKALSLTRDGRKFRFLMNDSGNDKEEEIEVHIINGSGMHFLFHLSFETNKTELTYLRN